MLEELKQTPEEKRTVEIILHTAVALFALYALVEVMAGLGTAPVLVGAVFALVGVGYTRFLRVRLGAGAQSAERVPAEGYRLRAL